MKVIISPAKTMKNISINKNLNIPYFIEETKVLVSLIQTLKLEDIMNMMKVNKKIAELTINRFKNFSFDNKGIPAIFAYDGIQFKNMELSNIKDLDYEYLNQTIKILSALYGVLNPLDSIYEYRLDMNTPFKYINIKNSYDFWGEKIYNYILDGNKNETIINLASDEYSKAISKYTKGTNFISCKFQQIDKNGNLKTNSTNSKKLRGAMVNFIIKNKITDPLEIKKFSAHNHKFNDSLSSSNEWIFTSL